MTPIGKDRTVLRDLATRYKDLCDSEANAHAIELWRALNSGRQVRPMVWCNLGLLGGEIDAILPESVVEDDELRAVERWFQKALWTATIGDDRVFHPWYAVRAEVFAHPEGIWGVARNTIRDPVSRGWRNLPVIRSLEDLRRLKATPHRVMDPHPPVARKLEDVFADIMPIHIDRSTVYPKWGGTDLSEAAGCLMGLEELLWALYDKPEMVHRLMAFMRDAVISNLTQAEDAGDFSIVETQNYLVPAYSDEMKDPAANSHGARLSDLCFFTHSQEFESVGPAQHEEFLLRYQLPILQLFGKVNYGCCETLDNKLDILKQIPNLTKVCAGPLADVSVYPPKIEEDCIISWRPNAAPMVCQGFDAENVRRTLRLGLEKTRGRPVEIHLHEPMTVEGDVSRVARWAQIAVQEAARIASK